MAIKMTKMLADALALKIRKKIQDENISYVEQNKNELINSKDFNELVTLKEKETKLRDQIKSLEEKINSSHKRLQLTKGYSQIHNEVIHGYRVIGKNSNIGLDDIKAELILGTYEGDSLEDLIEQLTQKFLN